MPVHSLLKVIRNDIANVIIFSLYANKKRQALANLSPCAVGESRTHTPQRALPPQSSVSTISPLPRVFGTAKIEKLSENTKFSEKIFNFAVPYGLREKH